MTCGQANRLVGAAEGPMGIVFPAVAAEDTGKVVEFALLKIQPGKLVRVAAESVAEELKVIDQSALLAGQGAQLESLSQHART